MRRASKALSLNSDLGDLVPVLLVVAAVLTIVHRRDLQHPEAGDLAIAAQRRGAALRQGGALDSGGPDLLGLGVRGGGDGAEREEGKGSSGGGGGAGQRPVLLAVSAVLAEVDRRDFEDAEATWALAAEGGGASLVGGALDWGGPGLLCLGVGVGGDGSEGKEGQEGSAGVGHFAGIVIVSLVFGSV